VIGPQNHRDALVGSRDPVILIPICTAPPGRGAEDMAAGQAQRLGVGIAGVGELRLAFEDKEPRPPIGVRDQDRAAGSRNRFLNFARVSVMEMPTPPSRGYTVTMLSCGIPFRLNEVRTPCGLS